MKRPGRAASEPPRGSLGEVRDVLAAVEREASLPEAERDSGASTDALLWVADLLTGVADDLAAGARRGAATRARSAARLAIDGWNLRSGLTDRVVGLAQLIARVTDDHGAEHGGAG